ncbi:MAG: hypothetical protein ACI8QS_001225 [Planctomycetota bacterium]|jgi:hypothetical protein
MKFTPRGPRALTTIQSASLAVICFLGLASFGPLAAEQESEPAAAQDEALVEVDAAQKEKATKVIDRVTKRLKDVTIMGADYSQERTSPLLIEPLKSKGRLFQRTQPACLLFQVASPHRANIRMAADSYQVHRPDEKTAERFLFEGEHAGNALLGAFRPEVKALFTSFALIAYGEVRAKGTTEGDATVAVLTLRPRDAKARRHVDNVVLRIDMTRSLPISVSYVDREGYAVNLALSNILLNAELEDIDGLFAAELPDDVHLLVHRIKAE